MARIVVVGSSNTDMVVQTVRIPGPGETVLGREFTMAAGGKGANQAVAAARLGAQVTLVARVGADLFGDRALEGLRKEGIDTRYVTVDSQAASGVALIFVDADGENSIGVAPGANARLSPDDVRSAQQAIEGAHALLLQLEIPLDTAECAAELAHRAGVMVILNPAPAPAGPLPGALLSFVDILTPNEGEARALLGVRVADLPSAREAALSLVSQGVGKVIITLGAQGALAVSSEVQQLVPGYPVEAVDTTAAGDAFNGGLAVALAAGKGLVEAVRFANGCGALAATKLGAQPSLPSLDEVSSLMA